MPFCSFRKPTEEELYRKTTAKLNRKMGKAFARVPFSERVIFVPHCMRNTEKCKAKELGSHYVCVECNACKIGPIQKKAKELGYKAVYVLKGGKIIQKLMDELAPGAVIGVACFFEGAQGMDAVMKRKIPVQFVSLTKDGCADTDVDLDEVIKVLEQK